MIIIIMDGTCTCPEAFTEKPGLNPSPENTGNNDGNEPINTTPSTASAKTATELVAPGLRAVVVSLEPTSRFFANTGSFILSKNSGSTFNSFPLFHTNKIPTSTPIMVDGIQMRRMSASLIPAGAKTVNKAADAADTGLAVMPIWAAVTLMLNALSGQF